MAPGFYSLAALIIGSLLLWQKTDGEWAIIAFAFAYAVMPYLTIRGR